MVLNLRTGARLEVLLVLLAAAHAGVDAHVALQYPRPATRVGECYCILSPCCIFSYRAIKSATARIGMLLRTGWLRLL